MVKKFGLFLFVASVLVVSLFFVLADFVDDGTLIQNVTDCGTLNTSYAVYTLNQSIDSGEEGDCLLIANESIVLDCAGYNITYYGNSSGGNGIFVFNEGTEVGYTNVTIKNCIVIQNESSDVNTSSAIFFGINSTNTTVYNNTIITYGNGSAGILFETNSINANISFNNITTSGVESYGILLGENGTNANITSNTVVTSGEDSSGIKMGDNSSGLVYNNTITASGNWSASGNTTMGGIFLETGTADINVSSNTIAMSGYDVAGIWVWSCSNHSIENNTITSSGKLGDGIYLSDVQGTNITSNIINITGEWGDGIDSRDSETALLFYGNAITTSGTLAYGFNLDQDSNSNISSNNITTSGTDSYGIFSNQSHNNTITNNILTTGTADSYVLYFVTTSNDSVYNNIFNTSTTGSGVFINDSDPNFFNTTNDTSTTNIIGRDYFGGNFWTNINGTGYSDICVNSNNDYFCDSAYVVMAGESHTDYLPLANHIGITPACATLNVANRYYVLNQSIEANGTCFNITANNITLDFAGFNVTGNSSGHGVNITGYNDTTISNGSIYNFSNGIYISSSSGNAFDDININGSQQDAILLVGATSDNNNFTSITVTNTNSSYIDINFSSEGINGTWIIGISNFANYSFEGAGGLVNFEEPSYGNIVFLEAINGSGTSLGDDVDVEPKWVFINSSANAGLNKSANISFYSVSYTDPKPQYSLDDSTWVNCTTATNPACVEFSFITGGTFIFNITYPAYFKIIEGYSATADTSSSSSGGGGGGGTTTYSPTEEKLREGYTLTLRKDYKVNFSISNENHTLNIDSVGENSVQITVSSEPQTKTLLVGDEVKFELDGDNIYDFSVKLESISGSSAKLLMKTISEEIPEGELVAGESDSLIKDVDGDGESDATNIISGKFWIWFGVIGIVLVAVIGIIYFRLKKE